MPSIRPSMSSAYSPFLLWSSNDSTVSLYTSALSCFTCAMVRLSVEATRTDLSRRTCASAGRRSTLCAISCLVRWSLLWEGVRSACRVLGKFPIVAALECRARASAPWSVWGFRHRQLRVESRIGLRAASWRTLEIRGPGLEEKSRTIESDRSEKLRYIYWKHE